jgi:hypothetical protein
VIVRAFVLEFYEMRMSSFQKKKKKQIFFREYLWQIIIWYFNVRNSGMVIFISILGNSVLAWS